MAYRLDAREKEIENKLRKDYFSEFDAEEALGDIDFAVAIPSDTPRLFEQEFLLWAEAKRSNTHDIKESIIQLILTIGKAKTYEQHLPPAYLGAFDAEKIALVPYYSVMDVFSKSFINWQVTPSDHGSDTFRLLMELIGEDLDRDIIVFNLTTDERELRTFIRRNFVVGKSKTSKIRINKTNFTAIYQKWLIEVKPTIGVNWEQAKRGMILDADFYLADIMSKDNVYLTLKDKLRVLLKKNHYELDREVDEMGLFKSREALFKDKQKAHTRFWNRYQRPPLKEYRDYIVTRRDLLVPQDIRERKGSFFTPAKWVALSQEFLAKELGENWQEEYYIWDCCAGTGNLLANLTNKYNIWASTLDKADVDVMHDRIRTMNNSSVKGREGSNLLDSHVFQFDFLNDPFTKLPEKLQEIVNDEEKRKKLIIYINPPYAEVSSKKVAADGTKGKKYVNLSKVHTKYFNFLGTAGRELFSQFFIRVFKELNGAILAEFSTLKIIQGSAFVQFRTHFTPELKSLFVVPADTFDNVNGDFPIGFFIWDSKNSAPFQSIIAHVYDSQAEKLGFKTYYALNKEQYLNSWTTSWRNSSSLQIGFLEGVNSNDFQHNNYVYIVNDKSQVKNPRGIKVTADNILQNSIYFAVRLCMEANWLNDRDQFLCPNEDWKNDKEFQSDCLIFTLFHSQNRISCEQGLNHFIPFTEEEVGANEKFCSHFMSDYIKGLIRKEFLVSKVAEKSGATQGNLFETTVEEAIPKEDLQFAPLTISDAATSVMNAGRALWRYYHSKIGTKADASLYDMRLYFQGTHKDGRGREVMNTESNDEIYTRLLTSLRYQMRLLAQQIANKVYDYGFLKRNYDPLIMPPRRVNVISEMMPPMDEEALVERDNYFKESEKRIVNVTIENKFYGPVGQVLNQEEK